MHQDGLMSRPATSQEPACTSCPHGRNRGRKAPCWPWDSVSRSSAPRSTAWPAPWAGPRYPRPARHPACPRPRAVTRPGGPAPRHRPRPGLRRAVHPRRSGRGIRPRLPPAARPPRQIRGAGRAAALTPAPSDHGPSPAGCRERVRRCVGGERDGSGRPGVSGRPRGDAASAPPAGRSARILAAWQPAGLWRPPLLARAPALGGTRPAVMPATRR